MGISPLAIRTGMRAASCAFLLATFNLASPLAAQDHEISAYIGHHPANMVNGMAFIDDPRVQEIVETALPDQGLRNLVLNQTRDRAMATVLFESQDAIYFYAYDPTHGSSDNWGVSVSLDGLDGAVCIAVGPANHGAPPAKWYREGKVITTQIDGCPSDRAGLALAFGG